MKMIKYFLELIADFKELFWYLRGERKGGGKNSEELHIYFESVNPDDLEDLKAIDGGEDGIDADNVPIQPQGNTTRCVPFGTAMDLSSICTRLSHSDVTFNGDYIRELMEKRGWYEEGEGAFIHHGYKAIVEECRENGFVTSVDGRKWYVETYKYVPKDKWDEVLAKLWPIGTGSYITHPMCNNENVFIPVKNGGGHRWAVIDDYGDRYLCRNSWKKWGILKKILNKIYSGLFWLDKRDVSYTFQGFVFQGVREIVE